MLEKELESSVGRKVEASCQLVSSKLPYEFTGSRNSDRKAVDRHFIQSQKGSLSRVTDYSSRKTYIFNVKTKGAPRTSQSIGCLQVLFYFVTVKRFHTHRRRAVGNLVDCPKTK
uniref:Uncharacterized protein n=1 Tax=Sus scrofa TaxID=9823 RepID=A0A480G5M6_PIG